MIAIKQMQSKYRLPMHLVCIHSSSTPTTITADSASTNKTYTHTDIQNKLQFPCYNNNTNINDNNNDTMARFPESPASLYPGINGTILHLQDTATQWQKQCEYYVQQQYNSKQNSTNNSAHSSQYSTNYMSSNVKHENVIVVLRPDSHIAHITTLQKATIEEKQGEIALAVAEAAEALYVQQQQL